MRRVVAIDGPAGSGKTTTSRGVAARLGLEVLDTGAMYRAAALAALRAGVDVHDAGAVAAATERSRIEVGERAVLDGDDVTSEIRGPEVTAAVSVIAANPAVRVVLVERQRAWVDVRGGGVVEGRDIGTVVFPDAAVKVFLTASGEERALRRSRDEEAADRPAGVEDVRTALARRDTLDSSRDTSPLARADDAIVIDTTGRRVEDVVEEIVGRFETAWQAGAEEA